MNTGPPAGPLAARPLVAARLDDPVRAVERRRLARELYDIVAHHVANVALRTMGRLDLDDLERIRAVLADVNRAAGSALVELRLLAHVIEDDPGLSVEVGGVSELSRRLTPSAAAEEWRQRLTAAGRSASFAVPAAADALALSVQSTIARTFAATAEVALAHAAAGAWCSTALHITSTEATVRTTIPLDGPAGPAGLDLDLGGGLRGLRERVDLSHGKVTAEVAAAPTGQRAWVLTVVLPLG